MTEISFVQELQGSHLELTEKNSIIGTRIFFATRDKRNDAAIPTRGSSWDVNNPCLKCVSLSEDEEENGYLYTCHYSTEGSLTDSFLERNFDIGCEVVDSTRSCKWKTAGTAVGIPISTVYPLCGYVITFRREYDEGWTPVTTQDAIFQCTGKLNDRKFHGCDEETLMFEGASYREAYNTQGGVISAEITFKFLKRHRSHNDAWREAKQKMSRDGVPYYYSDETNAKYPSDINHPDGEPVWVAGTAGTAAWDQPVYVVEAVEHKRYELANFATLLGIPIMTGDDAA